MSSTLTDGQAFPYGKISYVTTTKTKRVIDPRAKIRGDLLRQRRVSLQLSQQDVASSLGWERENISQLEKGLIKKIERDKRLGFCKLLGLEERELVLNPDEIAPEFDMPLSHDAKSIAYRWDDLPDLARAHLLKELTKVEQLLKDSPDFAKKLFEDQTKPPKKPRK